MEKMLNNGKLFGAIDKMSGEEAINHMLKQLKRITKKHSKEAALSNPKESPDSPSGQLSKTIINLKHLNQRELD